MKLIIDIPKKIEEYIKDYIPIGAGDNVFCYPDEIVRMIKNGTPIPDNATNGEWVDQYNDGNWHCSKCGAIVEKDEQINHNWYFCYHCGTKMNAPYQKGGNSEYLGGELYQGEFESR